MVVAKLREFLIRRSQVADVRRLPPEDVERLDAMFSCIESGDVLSRPSKDWVELNKMNVAQLQKHGYENFKRTIALNYFTFVRILPWDSQFRFLLRRLPIGVSLACLRKSLFARKHDYFSYFSFFNRIQSLLYNFLTHASWEYTRDAVSDAGLLALREPEDGNPAEIRDSSDALVSQDLANSILEVSAMGPTLAPGSVVLELGAGYGRDAYVILATNRSIKYVIVDIPPALWVAETYLRRQFPNLRIFQYREFAKFKDIEDEFNESDIAFFLSTQITCLPDGIADLAVNISSLHEMRPEQIAFYFSQFDRLLKDGGQFYFKEWKRGVLPFENITIRQEDYPIPVSWNCEYSRDAPIQTRFFEARYRKLRSDTRSAAP
jgi:putative sugar O-methyltransferase